MQIILSRRPTASYGFRVYKDAAQVWNEGQTPSTRTSSGVCAAAGYFGVVTSFEYRLHRVGLVLARPVFHPFTKAKEVLQFYRDFASATHEQLSTYVVPMTAPDGAKVMVIVVCYNGPLDEGERLIVPVRQFGPPLEDQIQPGSYTEFQSMFNAGFPQEPVLRESPFAAGDER